MISLESAVWVVLALIVGAVVFGLLWLLLNRAATLFPGEAAGLFLKFGQFVLILLAVLVLIGFLFSIVSGRPLFRLGP